MVDARAASVRVVEFPVGYCAAAPLPRRGASAPAAAVDPPDIIIISDDEDQRRAIAGPSHPVDPPGIIIISDEEDEQLAAVVRSRSIIVPHGDHFMAGAHDFEQELHVLH